MESELITMLDFRKKKLNLDQETMDLIVAQVFAEKKSCYLNEFNLYLAYYHTIPNLIQESNINCKRANKWFTETYRSEIKDWYFDKRYFNGSKKPEFDDIFYFLSEDLLVNFDTNRETVRFLFRMTDLTKVEDISSNIRKFKVKRERKSEISVLVNNGGSLEIETLKITRPKLKIEDNYNDDFLEIHKTIVKRLSRKNDKGLVLLHGMPGTGKTSYIRYLISLVKKEVIFMPPNLAGAITNPELISFFIQRPNSVFVIEDAEKIVISRENEGSSYVSGLLNLSDGLLSDCLNVQIICTFNTDISKVDNALLRKGRLIADYEFKELDILKAMDLSQKLGYNSIIKEPASLSAIYNQGEKDFQQPKKKNTIGFVA